MGQTKKQEEKEEQPGQKVGGVSSDSHKYNNGHVANQEGTLREESVWGMAVKQKYPSARGGIDGCESKQSHLLA